jgi:hypothetical protein
MRLVSFDKFEQLSVIFLWFFVEFFGSLACRVCPGLYQKKSLNLLLLFKKFVLDDAGACLTYMFSPSMDMYFCIGWNCI